MTKTEEFAKNFVLARTANRRNISKDKTGERRFLPVLADAVDPAEASDK